MTNKAIHFAILGECICGEKSNIVASDEIDVTCKACKYNLVRSFRREVTAYQFPYLKQETGQVRGPPLPDMNINAYLGSREPPVDAAIKQFKEQQ